MIEDQIFHIVDKIRNGLRKALDEGREKGELQDTDYLNIYEELIGLGYRRDKIFEWLISTFHIKSLKVDQLTELKKDELKVLFASLIELEEDEYVILEPILKLCIASIQIDRDHIISELASLIGLAVVFNRNTFAYDSSTGIKSNNNTQRLALLSKSYLDVCEGQYSLALSFIVFHIDVIKGKKRTFKKINGFNESDKLQIVENFDESLFKLIKEGYDSVIRNGSAHLSYGIVNWPEVFFSNTNSKGEVTTIVLSEDSLIDKSNKLFRVSQAVITGGTLRAIHPSYDGLTDHVNYEGLLSEIDINEFFRKYGR